MTNVTCRLTAKKTGISSVPNARNRVWDYVFKNYCEQGKRLLPNEWFDVFAALGFTNLCVNPFIYAARYRVFRKSLEMMLTKPSQ